MPGPVLWCVLGVCTVLPGCRKPSPAAVYQSMVDRQQRFFLEDQKYLLIDEVESLRAQLESCRRENDALKKAVAEGSKGAGDYSGGAIGLPPGIDKPASPLGAPPRVEGIPDLAPPRIEIEEGIEIDPGELPGLNESGSSAPGAAGLHLASHVATGDDAAEEQQPQDVVAIWLNPLLTGGYDEDRHSGDDGVLVMLEPRNVNKKLVVMPGDVDVALLDPAYPGDERAVVARWSFDSAEISLRFYKSIWGRGIRLRLPWPNRPPEHRRLRLFVRYRAPDGKQHVAQRDIDVALPGDPPEKLWRAPKGKPAAPPRPATEREPMAAEPTEDVPVREQPAAVINVEPPLAIVEPDVEAPRVAEQTHESSGELSPIRDPEPDPSPREAPPSSERRRPEWKPYR